MGQASSWDSRSFSGPSTSYPDSRTSMQWRYDQSPVEHPSGFAYASDPSIPGSLNYASPYLQRHDQQEYQASTRSASYGQIERGPAQHYPAQYPQHMAGPGQQPSSVYTAPHFVPSNAFSAPQMPPPQYSSVDLTHSGAYVTPTDSWQMYLQSQHYLPTSHDPRHDSVNTPWIQAQSPMQGAESQQHQQQQQQHHHTLRNAIDPFKRGNHNPG